MIRLSACALALGLVSTGAAAQTVASFAASACIPTDATITFDRHRIANASVRPAGDNLDPIALICPIAPFDFGLAGEEADYRLSLIYQDSTAMRSPAFVRARLYRLPIGAGPPPPPGGPARLLGDTPPATASLVAEVSSNESGATGVARVERAFTHVFDFEANIYWIRLELDRSATSQTVVAHAVYVWSTGPDPEAP